VSSNAVESKAWIIDNVAVWDKPPTASESPTRALTYRSPCILSPPRTSHNDGAIGISTLLGPRKPYLHITCQLTMLNHKSIQRIGADASKEPHLQFVGIETPLFHHRHCMLTNWSTRSVRNQDEIDSMLLLSATNRTPLITLWTASWCPSCKVVAPVIRELIERDGIGEKEGGVSYAEVEIDSPTLGDLAMRYIVRLLG